MSMSSSRWSTIAESAFPWEQDALEWLRQTLPDHDPWRAWSNFEFIAADGSINEVDLLVLSPAGLFLVEIKSRPGTLEGDAHTWTWTTDGRRYSHDNPLILTNKKAKRLASLLRAQPALRGQRLPRLEPLVFLSAGDLRFRLTGLAATGAHRRGRPGQPDDDGIIAAMGGSPTGRRDPGRSLVNRRLSGSIAKALDTAGVRPSQARRRVGDYALTELLSEDEAY